MSFSSWRASDAGDAEEAEYAWLPVDCLKPFKAGDETGNSDGIISADATLQACVGAADRVVGESAQRAARRAAAMEAEQGPSEDDQHTDSDGGA